MSKTVLEGKTRLPVKVVDVINDHAAVLNQVIKGSKCSEVLNVAAKNFCLQEAAIENSDNNLRRMVGVVTNLNVQLINVQKNIEIMSEVQDRLQALEKTDYCTRL